MRYSGQVDIQQVIDDSPFSGFHWVLIVLGFLVLAIDGFDTAAMGYIAPTRPAVGRYRPGLSRIMAGEAYC